MVFSRERDGDLYEQIKEALKLTRQRNRAMRLKQLLHAGLVARGYQPEASVTSPLKPVTVTRTNNESSKGQDENRKMAALLVLLAARLDSK